MFKDEFQGQNGTFDNVVYKKEQNTEGYNWFSSKQKKRQNYQRCYQNNCRQRCPWVKQRGGHFDIMQQC
jgi:hypothetical protein